MSYRTSELIINRALYEYEENKKIIDDMLRKVPKYSETDFVSRVKDMLREMKTIIHNQDLQKDLLKKGVTDMIKICGEKYNFSGITAPSSIVNELPGSDFPPMPEEKENIPPSKSPGEEEVKVKVEEEEDTQFKSSLTSKKVEIPEDERNKVTEEEELWTYT